MSKVLVVGAGSELSLHFLLTFLLLLNVQVAIPAVAAGGDSLTE